MAPPIPHLDMDDARRTRALRQHASTAKLLGVDFLPLPKGVKKLTKKSTPASAGAARVEVKMVAPQAGHGSAASVPPASMPPANAPNPGTLTFDRPARHAGEDDRAYKARALAHLLARYEADAPHKHFKTAHTNIVFGDGDPAARLCFVGEAPGEEEDKTGKPFVGRSGQLLEKMIIAMGLSRETVYICNVLKTRPPNNATPTGREAALCEPYLFEQLSIVNPSVIVTLGLPAVRTLLKTEDSMTRLRGSWASVTLPAGGGLSARAVPVMPTYHPAYLLRNYTEDARRKVWSDLQLVVEKLKV